MMDPLLPLLQAVTERLSVNALGWSTNTPLAEPGQVL
jgi:hypothetical protein